MNRHMPTKDHVQTTQAGSQALSFWSLFFVKHVLPDDIVTAVLVKRGGTSKRVNEFYNENAGSTC
jgi:hypothetical protein